MEKLKTWQRCIREDANNQLELLYVLSIIILIVGVIMTIITLLLGCFTNKHLPVGFYLLISICGAIGSLGYYIYGPSSFWFEKENIKKTIWRLTLLITGLSIMLYALFILGAEAVWRDDHKELMFEMFEKALKEYFENIK